MDHQLDFVVHGQGGLLDIIHKDNIVWISYTEDRGNYKTSTSIARAELNKKKLVFKNIFQANPPIDSCLLYTSPSPRDTEVSRMPSSA